MGRCPPSPASDVPEREPAPGDVLGGRYEIQSELGRGGMATVFRGRDLRLHRRVAVKVFRDAFAESVDPQRRTQEMQLLAAVNHPSVVGVLDASTGDGVFGAYLVMELVVGDDLGALLHRARGPLSADFARRIVADVAGALQVLHAQGIVHRDVKPANILVPTTAASPTAAVAAKLTDFGIAQLVDGAAMTAPETILGTAAYLSPEQVRGAPPRPASDVYSLGLVLLEALTGERAFPGAAAEAAMARLHRPPALPGDASPALADLLSRMTALEPAHRPDAASVAEALRGGLVGRVTAPDAITTAPTPIAGIRAAAPLPPLSDATAPHEALWTPSRGMPFPVPASTGAVRTTGAAPVQQQRRRFPTVLAVAASVLAAAVAGVAISAAAGTDAPQRTPAAAPQRVDASAPASVGAPSASAPERGLVTKRLTPKPSPTPTKATPTPTPSTSSPTPTPTTTAPPPSTDPLPTDPEPVPTTDPGTPTVDPAPTSAPVETPPPADPVAGPVADPTPTAAAPAAAVLADTTA